MAGSEPARTARRFWRASKAPTMGGQRRIVPSSCRACLRKIAARPTTQPAQISAHRSRAFKSHYSRQVETGYSKRTLAHDRGDDSTRQPGRPKGVPTPYCKVDDYRLCPWPCTTAHIPPPGSTPVPPIAPLSIPPARTRKNGATGLNLHRRRHLSAEQRAYIAAKFLMRAEEEKARERQACGQGGTLLPENLPEANKGDARDLAAAQVGLSGKTVDAAARAIKDGSPAR